MCVAIRSSLTTWDLEVRFLEYSQITECGTIRMNSLKNTQSRAEHVAQIVKAIAHPVRLRILAILCEGARNVTTLSVRLEIAQSLISQHLRVMRSEGLVTSERRGSRVYYALARERLKSLIRHLDDCP